MILMDNTWMIKNIKLSKPHFTLISMICSHMKKIKKRKINQNYWEKEHTQR